MSGRKLDETAMQSELTGSAFFDRDARVSPAAQSTPERTDVEGGASQETSEQDNKPAITLASEPANVVEFLRHTVKNQGKEVSFIRMTAAEKASLADIVYTYKRRGLKTSENEVNRIAVNFMLEDYRVNGANSFLAKVLDALAA